MFFDSDFMRLYEALERLNEKIIEEDKKEKKNKQVSVQEDLVKLMDSFLTSIDLVRISNITMKCSDFSSAGAAVWVPSNRVIDYTDSIPYFDVLATKRLPKFVETLPSGEWPIKMWAPNVIQNNDGRFIIEIDLGELNRKQWRGLGFRFRVNDKPYFVFGDIFYKGYQKINGKNDGHVQQANYYYDLIMKKLKEFNNK